MASDFFEKIKWLMLLKALSDFDRLSVFFAREVTWWSPPLRIRLLSWRTQSSNDTAELTIIQRPANRASFTLFCISLHRYTLFAVIFHPTNTHKQHTITKPIAIWNAFRKWVGGTNAKCQILLRHWHGIHPQNVIIDLFGRSEPSNRFHYSALNFKQ